jgi:hypothetical protein
MPFPFASILLGSHLLIAAGAQVPSIDIRKSCQETVNAVDEMMTGGTVQRDFDGCLSSEQAAHEQLTTQWTKYSAAEKAQCVQPSDFLPSYVEWLSCLEMEVAVRSPDSTPP